MDYLKRAVPSFVGALILVMCIIVAIPFEAFAASTPIRYEYYITGADNATAAYGDNWVAQTFNTTSSHTITQVKLKLYRTGTPGIFYVALREADINGHPTNVNLTYGSLDGDTLTTNTTGALYAINMTYEISLEDDTKYALVLWTGGNVDNAINWRYNSAGSYSSGNYEYSTNGGTSWTADTDKDLMFEVWGNPTLEIVNVKVFSSTMVDGDWLIAVHYKCEYTPPYPAGNPEDYFYLSFNATAGGDAKVAMPAWGYKPAYIYLSPTVAGGFTWGDSSAVVSIVGREDFYGVTPPSYDYELLYNDWKGANLFQLDAWMRGIAQDIEDYYSVDVYTEVIGDTTLPAGQGVLTTTGGEIFLEGMPGLDELRPYLFYAVVRELIMPEGEWTQEYQESLDWAAQVGPDVADVANTWAAVFNPDFDPENPEGVSGQLLLGVIIFGFYVVGVGWGVTKTGEPAIATGAAVPVLLYGWWLGVIPLAIAAIVGALLTMITVWIIFWRGT